MHEYRNANDMIIQIKENIKTEIKKNKTSVQAVCNILGKHRNFINRMTDEVKLNKIIDIAHAIGCTPSDLLKGL